VTAYAGHLRDDALAIFLFHGVVAEPTDGVRNYTRKHLDAATFGAVVGELAAAGEPVSMDDVVAAHEGGAALPPRAFAITFDDGFRNNLTVAAPILERAGVPATFYVTTGFVAGNGASWIDTVEAALAASTADELVLPWESTARPSATTAQRIAVAEEVRRVVKSTPELDPYAVAEEIAAAAGTPRLEPDPELDDKLTWDEVRELAAQQRFIVGGHSHTHRVLSFLDAEELEREVAVSTTMLAEALGAPVRHYSYPEGLEHCYSDAVIAALRRHGVVCAPTAIAGVNPPGADLFELRRIAVP
jgi:peptidoglycan/xylan/chitin deacetylase (PgdA/CDA1 family)